MDDLIYSAQFQVIRVWVDGLQPADLASPSILPGWTVADLVSHLSSTGRSIAALREADQSTEPMSLSDYVANYAEAADSIGQRARDTRASAGADLIAELHRADEEAQLTLNRLGGSDRIVVSDRGPILLSDFLDTRLIELVVHAGDLARSLSDRNGPTVLPSARRRVLYVFRELLTEKARDPVPALAAASALDPVEFLELSAGRRRPGDDLPAALSDVLPLF